MGSVAAKAEAGRGELAGWSQFVDPACSVTFFSKSLPSLESHPAQIGNYEESSFLLSCKLASQHPRNHCLPNVKTEVWMESSKVYH